jgi:hypothetical protein
MNDKLIETVISRAGVVRVRNALNALLWLLAISLPLCLSGIYLFRDDAVLKYGFLAGFIFPLMATIIAFFWLMIKDPNRLQSEEFILRQQELSIERKEEPSLSIDQKEAEDTIAIDARPEKRSLGERP